MKIRNIVQIITLMGLAVTGSAYSMWANGLKKAACTVLQKAGTCLGYGIPMIAPISNARGHYVIYKNPELFAGSEVRDPSEAEAQYLRQFIDKKAKLKIKKFNNENFLGSTEPITTSSCIFMPELVIGPNKTIEEALKTNDTEALNTFAACAEHENQHFVGKHNLKLGAMATTVPLATTLLASICARKIFPYKPNTSVLRHTGKFFAKTAGGLGLAIANGILTQLLASKLSKKYELEADQNISARYRDDAAKSLTTMYTHIVNLPESDAKKAIINQINFAYPDPNVRIAKLRQNDDTKQA